MSGPWAEVAVDAVGPQGGQTFTYRVPATMPDLAAGEAVLVEYGRRRALGVVLALTDEEPEFETKPIEALVRSDGPLLPPVQLALARHIWSHYLAPPAVVIRQMLAPGVLERVERTVRRAGDDFAVEWQVSPAAVGERYERRASLTDEGRALTNQLNAGGPNAAKGKRPLGPRQRSMLLDLHQASEPVATARLAERYGSSPLPALVRRGLVQLETARVDRRPREGRAAPVRGTMPAAASLTAEQQIVADRLTNLIETRTHRTLLLEGATASGKTAVYAAAIAAAIREGRGALVLVPEVALAMPLLERLQHDLGVEVAVLHSSLADGERADEWRRIRSGEVSVVVGTRSSVLAPLGNVGVIVVDEEHDAAYKSERTPRIQARDLAVVLGRLADAPVVLGSATPEVASVGRARSGEYELHRLPERVSGTLPRVEVVDLRAELAAGNRGLLSRRLTDAIGDLDRSAGDQAILLINRRGSASVVVCRDCGYVQVCPECQRPLVFHAAALTLRCHHCGASAPVARRCPACDSPRIRYLGGGTERVEREVGLRFPALRVARLDRDVVERKGAAVRVVDDFSAGRTDVLVGTALVAKGLDVPQVTLVGVVSADVALNLPDERAAERTFQLLGQAIGRAGRGERPAAALIQTYLPDHPVIRAVATAMRRPSTTPSWSSADFQLAAVRPRGEDDRCPRGSRRSRIEGDRDGRRLRVRAEESAPRVEVLGPVPAYVARRAGRWRFHVVIRGDEPRAVLDGDPGAPWSIDVDPESLL